MCSIFMGTQRWFPSKDAENTFQAIQSTLRYLEMHSKRRCKICICSVFLGELQSFRNYEGLSIHIFECENFRFRFFYEK